VKQSKPQKPLAPTLQNVKGIVPPKFVVKTGLTRGRERAAGGEKVGRAMPDIAQGPFLPLQQCGMGGCYLLTCFAIASHAFWHFRHSSAHAFMWWSSGNFSHAFAHWSQHFAQHSVIRAVCGPPLAHT
jgi:hypothetical protein